MARQKTEATEPGPILDADAAEVEAARERYRITAAQREAAQDQLRNLQALCDSLVCQQSELSKKIAQAVSVLVDTLLDSGKLDTEKFLTTHAENRAIAGALQELQRRIPTAYLRSLKMQARERFAEADLARKMADREERKAVDAVVTIAPVLGPGVIEMRETTWERRRNFAAKLDIEGQHFLDRARQMEETRNARRD